MTGHLYTGDIREPERRLTWHDLLLMPDDGQRHELIDGRHYVSPSPGWRHQSVSVRLASALAAWLDAHPIGRVFTAPLDCKLSLFDVVEPDVFVVTQDQEPDLLGDVHIEGAPALVVEIVSPRTRRRDRSVKRRLYAERGVREYWVIDAEARSVDTYRRIAEGMFAAQPLLESASGDAIATPLLPGFSLALTDLFRDAE